MNDTPFGHSDWSRIVADVVALGAGGKKVGVMRVINMAHGEFIMMGAYTAFTVQTLIADRTLSLIVALPLAFIVTFGAGVVLYRLVIRHLAHRPLETLLATFGVSIARQQLAKNIFGTQARPLTAPAWLEGSIVINDVIGISSIRVAILVLALLFLALFLFIMKRTRLGLEVRAVTQNPGMAASMGINPDRIAMMTFGLGSGIAGIAAVAGALYYPQAGIINPAELMPIASIYLAVWVAIGGRGRLYGAVIGAVIVSLLSSWFTGGRAPSIHLPGYVVNWVDWWQVALGLTFVLVTLFAPRGIAGVVDLMPRKGGRA